MALIFLYLDGLNMKNHETKKTKKTAEPRKVTQDVFFKEQEQLIRQRAEMPQWSSPWSQSSQHELAIRWSRDIRQLKHGMYASIPIICRGESCPYRDNCPLFAEGFAPEGEKCPLEIAAIQDLTERYCTELNIDVEDPYQAIDVMMVKDLVDIDISMLRCDNKMAVTADFIVENVVGVTDNFESITRQELNPILEFKEKLRTMKFKTLQLLNSTRKDKEGQRIVIEDPSQKAARMMKLRKDIEVIDQESMDEEAKYYDRIKNPTIIEIKPNS